MLSLACNAQVYELWFKQILWELDSVVAVFSSEYVSEADVGLAISRLKRVGEIMRILVDQVAAHLAHSSEA